MRPRGEQQAQRLLVAAFVLVTLALSPIALVSCDLSAPPVPLMTLRVTRDNGANSFPRFERTVTDAAVNQLYAAALALPRPQPGLATCVHDLGVFYRLTFASRALSARQMTLDASGCRLLVIGAADARQTDDAFITRFQQTVGLASLIPQ